MKFTNGYWLTRKGIESIYAVEYGYHRVEENTLTVFAPSTHVPGRAATVNIPSMTVTLTSPMENVIKVSLVHFKGYPYEGPFFEVQDMNPAVSITEDETYIYYKSGNMTARICKMANSWKIEYYDGDRYLTETSYRNMAHMQNTNTGKSYMLDQLAIDVDEYFYGLGERFTPFVKNGQIVDMWNEDGGTASELTYKNIPFYISNKGYGVLVDNLSDVSFEIASEKVERVQFSVEGERLDYYIIGGGSAKAAITNYTALTGRPALPPAWTFGLWLSTSFSTDYNEEIVTGFLDEMERREIPLSVFHFDSFWMHGYEWCNFEWDSEITSDPEGMLRRYHDRGLKLCVWINPYIAQNSKLFDEAAEAGYLIRLKNGAVWQTDLWQAGMAEIDFTNPEAVKWYQGKLERLIDMGVDCFKTDFGERIPVKDVVYFDGSDPVKMHNYYSVMYNQTVFGLLERKFGKGQAAVFARAASVGGQKFPVHWGGDCSATYVSMAETLRGGLSLAMCGFGFWSHDMSGFEQTATPDIYKRWAAFGMLSSHSRLHGGVSYRVPWAFDEECCDVLKRFVNLKCRLMPYLYGLAVEAHKTGVPMHRPMVLEFPKDRACETLDKQYMFGGALLIAPIFKESGEVEYYIPDGTWVNLLTGKAYEGGKWMKETFDYFSLPLLVRPNTILPMGSCETRPDYDYADGLTILLSEFEDGAENAVTIPDMQGNDVCTVYAKRVDSRIEVSVSSGKMDASWKIEKLGNAECEIVTV